MDEEVEGPSGLRLEVVVPAPPQVTIAVPPAPCIDLVDVVDDAMIYVVHRRIDDRHVGRAKIRPVGGCCGKQFTDPALV